MRATPLAGHPKAFQLAGERIFVNIPSARQIAVLDRQSGRVTTWPVQGRANYPMAVDPDAKQVISVFRDPARITVFDAEAGREITSSATCSDADDVWLDTRRGHVYVSCGDGHIAVLSRDDRGLKPIESVRTIEGARTSLFAPDPDLLFLAARAHGPEKAAVWVFRPVD